MRRNTFFYLAAALAMTCSFNASAQSDIVQKINSYGTFDHWSGREIKESGVIGGASKTLYEFYGNEQTVQSNNPFKAPAGYYWRTNNVLAVVAGITKANVTVFPEKRGSGYCARIETHTEEVKAAGIINLDVVCQGALLVGALPEPIKDTKNPMAKVLYGIPFNGRPTALQFDYKAIVGCEAIRGTGFSGLKPLGKKDYPEAAIILQKRWEDEKGQVHALRVGTGIFRFTKNTADWVNGFKVPVKYGDISKNADFKSYMGLMHGTAMDLHTLNSQGKNVTVIEEGWAAPDEEPNFMIIKFLSSCGLPFEGGVGNTLWLDNIKVIM